MDRRTFLKLLGLGAASTAAGLVLPDVERVRRYWAVPANAPFGGPPRFSTKLRSAVLDEIERAFGDGVLRLYDDRGTVLASVPIAPSLALDKHELVRFDAPRTEVDRTGTVAEAMADFGGVLLPVDLHMPSRSLCAGAVLDITDFTMRAETA